MRMATSGTRSRSSFDLVFHFGDPEQLGLVDAVSGDALIRQATGWALYAARRPLVQAVHAPVST